MMKISTLTARAVLPGFMLLLGVAGAARADDASWTVVATTATRNIYLQTASVRPHGTGREAWTYYDFKQAQTLGALSYLSSRHLYDYDCTGGRLALRQSYYYGGTHLNGAEVRKSDFAKPDWAKVGEPGSVGEIAFRKVCGQKL